MSDDSSIKKIKKVFQGESWGIKEFSVLIFAIAVQLWDLNVRLSGTYFSTINYQIISLYFSLAVIAAIILDKKPPFKKIFARIGIGLPFFQKLFGFLLFSFIAYCIPFANYIFMKIPEYGGIPLRTITSAILIFWPIWIIYLAFSEPKKLARWAGSIYLLIWVIILIVSIAPLAAYQLQDAEIPGVMPGRTIGSLYRELVGGAKEWKQTIEGGTIGGYEKIKKEIQIGIEYSKTGIDPTQAKVDAANKRDLGVQVLQMKASSPVYYENDQVNVYAQIKAETLEQPVTTKVKCYATSEPIPGQIFPSNEFTIETYDVQDVDCVFPSDNLEEGLHTIHLDTEFNFETVSYFETFFMNEETLRELQKKKQDPLAGYPKPSATSSKGPVNINIKTPEAPIPSAPDKRMTLSITLHNTGPGQIKELKEVYIFIPKGLGISTAIDGRKIYQKIECNELPSEEAKVCVPDTTTVYKVSADELKKELYKNIVLSREFRLYLEIQDYDALLGESIIKPGNIYASAKYDYEMDQKVQIKIQKQPTSI
ncbi:hypothetical protein GF358_00655 [Candidatus Woesearchaeota archaeon]|nr:hypothetical protein [Candidatus Woesearchaeota archaeon]